MSKLFVAFAFVFSSAAFGAANMAKPSTVKSVKATSGQVSVKRESVTPPRLNRPRIVPAIALASFDVVGMDDVQTDQGLFLGANVQLDRGPIALVGGAGYLEAGGKISNEVVKADLLLSYLTVHGGAKLFVEPSRTLYFTGGLTPMLNLHSTYDARIVGGQRIKGKIHNVRDFDTLAKIGVGFEALVNRTNDMRIGGELSYNRGLFDITTAEGVNYNQGYLFTGFLKL